MRMGPLSFELFHSSAKVKGIVARNVAVGESMVGLVAATVCNELEVA